MRALPTSSISLTLLLLGACAESVTRKASPAHPHEGSGTDGGDTHEDGGANPSDTSDTSEDSEPGGDSGGPDTDGGSSDDADGDGWADEEDCFPAEDDLYPGAPGLCDGRSCGWDFCGGLCGGVACAEQPTSNTVLQVVGSWYVRSTSDSVLTEDPSESPARATFLGQRFYAPDSSADGDVPIYRLYHRAPGTDADDHMASTSATEGSPDYSLEALLAHGWSSEREGTGLLTRYISTSPYDHDAAFEAEPPAGYAPEGGLAWVYPRYGTSDEELTTISGAEVTLGVNRVAGGAVWSLQWGGIEFLSAYDFGRQLQIAFQANGAGEGDNPTEAGDAHAAPSDPDGWRHGSPLLDIRTGTGTVWTRTRPLQWLPEGFHTAAHDTTRNPVAWDGTFEKDITLDYGGNPHIVAWTTRITLPEAHASLNIELATAYLTGRFDTFYTYDAATGSLVDKTAGIPHMNCVDPSIDPDQQPEAGGVILSTSTSSHALGIYRNRSLNSVEGYGLCGFLDGGTSPRDFATSKWNLLERPIGGLDAGTYSWDLFVVVGSLRDCVNAMDELYARGE